MPAVRFAGSGSEDVKSARAMRAVFSRILLHPTLCTGLHAVSADAGPQDESTPTAAGDSHVRMWLDCADAVAKYDSGATHGLPWLLALVLEHVRETSRSLPNAWWWFRRLTSSIEQQQIQVDEASAPNWEAWTVLAKCMCSVGVYAPRNVNDLQARRQWTTAALSRLVMLLTHHVPSVCSGSLWNKSVSPLLGAFLALEPESLDAHLELVFRVMMAVPVSESSFSSQQSWSLLLKTYKSLRRLDALAMRMEKFMTASAAPAPGWLVSRCVR
jgi:hypothetical protein